jgi:hypothetical protein
MADEQRVGSLHGRSGVRLRQGAQGITPLGDSYFFGALPITLYCAYIEVCTLDSIEKSTNQTRKQQTGTHQEAANRLLNKLFEDTFASKLI